jgi:mRNA interferase RelE/StbE
VNTRYTVVVMPSAVKQIEQLDGPVRARVLRRIEALGDDPRPQGVVKLAGANDLWRVRLNPALAVSLVGGGC